VSQPSPAAALRELASRIYIQVLGRTITAESGKLTPGIDPEALATLSLKLAEVFLTLDDEASARRIPASAFELDASNLASWSKPAPPDGK